MKVLLVRALSLVANGIPSLGPHVVEKAHDL